MARDAAGNTAECTVTIIVRDNQAPIVTCPNSFSVTAAVGKTTVPNVIWTDPFAFDNYGTPMTVMSPSFPRPGTTLPLGTYAFLFNATDLAGNVNECNFSINVLAAANSPAGAASAATTTVGASAGGVLLIVFVVVFVVWRRTKARMQALEERVTFHENEDWVLQRALAIEQARRIHKVVAPDRHDLPSKAAGRINAPADDLEDLGDLDIYMPCVFIFYFDASPIMLV